MVFDPLKYDFAAEGGGSRRARPAVLPRPNYGVAGPSGALFRDVPQQAARDPRPKQILSLAQTRPDPREMPDPGPQASTAGVAPGTFTYPAVLPPLSPEAQEAFLARRRAATRAEEEARAQVDRQRQMAEAAAVQGRAEIARQQGEQSRAGLSELAGRGVARSPMFVNPFQRGVARQAQQRVGELEAGLSQTLENLNAALQAAENARDRELAQIETDIVMARSNVPGLLGA